MQGPVTANERAIDADMVAALADETGQPLPVVRRVYDREFARLRADARIPDYLVLFASRRTRDVLTRRRS